MAQIKTDRKDVISQALSVLVEGICNQNGYGFSYSGVESVEALPVDRLPTIADELKAAKAIINQQLDQLAARILYLWNTACLVHQLPVEVLAMIFGEFRPTPPGSDSSTSLLDLLLVCRTWHDVIVGSPQLWDYFGAEMSYKIAQLVINRSQTSSFSVKWDTWNLPLEPRKSGLCRMMDLLIENSTRVQKIDIRASRSGRPSLQKFLSAPTPKLETLRVQVELYGSDEDGYEPLDYIILSDGPLLEHLSLQNVDTQMNSPRFSNLVTLQLEHSTSSMLFENLFPVLSSSRRLEKLHIRGYSAKDDGGRATTPITLPHLKELVLSGVRSRYTVAMLASIYTPRCSHVEIDDHGGSLSKMDEEAVEALDAVVWRPGNDQATVILGGADSTLRPSALEIGMYHAVVTVRSPKMAEPHCNLRFARVDVPRMVKGLVTILSHWHSCPPIELQLDHGYIWRTNGLDLSFWSEHVYSLRARGRDVCRSVIQLLLRRELIPGRGQMDWAFRKLSKIEIVYTGRDVEDTALDAEALLSVVQQRWFGQDGLAPATQPSHFEVFCSLTNFPRLTSLENEFKRIIPSFKLTTWT
ncbi:hypothetical protein FRC01_004039 [Tulasnella sp. 417]|nr:hypothetical protein FRC01_004039 [Tulasnella sp. 417]